MPSIEIITKMAERGLSNRQFELGKIYAAGHHTERNWQLGAYWLEQARKEEPEAFFLLYDMYSMGGYGLEKDTDNAVSFLHELADQDCEIFKNDKKTKKACQIARANYRLFQLYEAGEVVPHNHTEALKYLDKAIKYESLKAKFARAEINEASPSGYRAAVKGYKDILSDLSHDLLHHLQEHFYPHDHFFEKKPNIDYTLYANAALNLGRMYEEGRGVEPDHEIAFNHYRFAAELDHPQAGARYAALRAQQKSLFSFLMPRRPVLAATPTKT
jgi:TPR repeat protein